NDTVLSSGSNILFSSTLDSDAVGTPRALAIASGAADVMFTGLVGNAAPLKSISQTGGTGTTTFNGATLMGDLSIATDTIVLQTSPVTTNTSGVTGVNLNAQNGVTIAAN